MYLVDVYAAHINPKDASKIIKYVSKGVEKRRKRRRREGEGEGKEGEGEERGGEKRKRKSIKRIFLIVIKSSREI